MEKKKQLDSDKPAEKKLFMDIDRMTNEGLAGGTVSMKFDSGQIEEAIDFEQEEPPYHAEEE